MLTFILCVERYTHLPCEIYRLLATYLYYKKYWPDVNIKKYNKVLKQLPYPILAKGPCAVYCHNDKHSSKMAKLCYDIPLQQQAARRGRLVTWKPCISINEYSLFKNCPYENGVSAYDFTIMFNNEVSTGEWEFVFYPNNDNHLSCSWLEKIEARLQLEYQERIEYFKSPNVKKIKYFNSF